MDVSYRRDKDHNYMVLDAPGMVTGEEYQVRMIIGNQIPHILKCNKRMMDGKAVFFYEITGMQPMFRKFEKTLLNREDITDILYDIKKALEHADRYLLDENQLLFEPEYLFFDLQTRTWNMCYLPSYQGNVTDNFRVLAEYILKRLDHSDEQAVRLGYEIYSKASEENYRISEILQMAYQIEKEQPKVEGTKGKTEERIQEKLEKDSFCEEAAAETIQKEILKEIPKEISKEIPWEIQEEIRGEDRGRKKKKKVHKHKHIQFSKRIIWYTVCLSAAFIVTGILLRQRWISLIQAGGIWFLILGILAYRITWKKEDLPSNLFRKKQKFDDFSEDMGTCVLREGENTHMAMLVSLQPEENINILLYKDETRIGKEERQADVCIAQDVISRVHARIQKEEGEYYIIDLDSTNGTYINGRKLIGTEKVKLQQGDHVSFANVEYIFQMSVNPV